MPKNDQKISSMFTLEWKIGKEGVWRNSAKVARIKRSQEIRNEITYSRLWRYFFANSSWCTLIGLETN